MGRRLSDGSRRVPTTRIRRLGLFGAGAVVLALAAACAPVAPKPAPAPPAPPPTTTTAPPPAPQWHFENVDGTGVAGTGRTNDGTDSPTNAAATLDGVAHDFYTAYVSPTSDRLRHAWIDGSGTHTEDLDGPGVAGGNGRTTDPIMQVTSAVVVGSTLHVFYVDGTTKMIRHAAYDGTGWTFETIPGSDAAGDQHISPVALNGQVHVFYGHMGTGMPAVFTLRHLWFDGTSWQLEDLDGAGVAGGNGRFNGSVGAYAAAASNGVTADVFYTNNDTGGIRRAHYDGSTWSFDAPPEGGPLQPNAAVVVGSVAHAFVYDAHFQDLLHFWFDGSWHSDSNASFSGGTACTIVPNARDIAAAVVNGLPTAFYQGNTGQLCTTKWSAGSFTTEVLDGNSAPATNGRVSTLSELGTAVTVNGTTPHVFYGNHGPASPPPNNGQLRHAVLN